jgi:hypothetical protein
MAKKVVERNGRLIVVEEDTSVSQNHIVRSALKKLGCWFFRLFYTGQIAPDGFAITPLTIEVNDRPYSDDLRPRYITPSQQAKIGLSGLPWLAVPLIVLSGFLQSYLDIKIVESFYDKLDEIIGAVIIVIILSCFVSTGYFFWILSIINSQFYEEKEIITEFGNDQLSKQDDLH